jgi:type I restriction enzyme S subunit
VSFPTIKLGEACDTSSGGTPRRGIKAYYGGHIPWVKSGELRDGIVAGTAERITDEGLRESAARILPAGTLMMAMYGATVGRLGILEIAAATNQAICAIIPDARFDTYFLFYWLLHIRRSLVEASFGGAQPNISQTTVQSLDLPLLPLERQRTVAEQLRRQFHVLERSNAALATQLLEVRRLANSIVAHSTTSTTTRPLSEVLEEVKNGVGENWKGHRVLGATRAGLAPAKERPGKNAPRYKPVTAGTLFYNPMRILIGSIAFVDDDDEPGITSPDYVVLRGRRGLVDSRWFYYWLRSPLGERRIQAMARGAVRERMLYNRLAEGDIELPDYDTQLKASKALAQIKPMRAAIRKQIQELELMPQKLLAQQLDF